MAGEDNVINLRQDLKEDLVALCPDCNSTTFMILSCGEFECNGCGSRITDDISGVDYSKVRPVVSDTVAKTDYGAVDIAFHSVLSRAKIGETSAVIVMNKSGRTFVWSEGADGDQERVDWYRERVGEMMGLLV